MVAGSPQQGSGRRTARCIVSVDLSARTSRRGLRRSVATGTRSWRAVALCAGAAALIVTTGLLGSRGAYPAHPGNELEVAQQGSLAYVVNRTTGSVRRVDGATLLPTPAAPPPAQAGRGLQVFPGTGVVFVVDTQRGLATTVDPQTLAGTGPALSLAAQVDPQAASVDDAGAYGCSTPRQTGQMRGALQAAASARRHAVISGRSSSSRRRASYPVIAPPGAACPASASTPSSTAARA